MTRCEKCEIPIWAGTCQACEMDQEAEYRREQADVYVDISREVRPIRRDARMVEALKFAEHLALESARNFDHIAASLRRSLKGNQP